MSAFTQCYVLTFLLMNKERLIGLFVVSTSPLLVINAFIEHSAANFLVETFGSAVAEMWGYLLRLIVVAWCLLIAFVVFSFVYLFITERLTKKKQKLQINSDKEIVLNKEQKELLIKRIVLDISFVFNSEHRGIEPFSEVDRNIKFAVLSADSKEAESEMQQYIAKYLGKQVAIEPGRNAGTRRWDRIVTLS